jgi:two-component system NarL family sensor kinase
MPSSSSEISDHAEACDAKGPGRGRDRLVVEMVERDRLRFAGALHNSACQSVSGLQLFAATLSKRLADEPRALGEAIDELTTLLRQVSTELRGVVQWLRPPPMREGGLMVSLLELAAEISRSIPCEFHCDDRRMQVDSEVAKQFYHVSHAVALALVQRGTATRIEIELAADGQHGLRLSVWDDSNSSDRSAKGRELDLCNWELLELRSRAIGGTLTVDSPRSGGTCVTCHVAGA